MIETTTRGPGPSPPHWPGQRFAAGAQEFLKVWAGRGLALLSRLQRAGVDQDIRWTRQFGARLARVLLLAGMSFRTNQVPVRASALTYTTILASAPFAIILSAVAARFGYLDLLSRLIPYLNVDLNLNLPMDQLLLVIENAQKVDFHRLGMVGSLGLLFAFFLSMSNIELAFDNIWGIRKKRNWWQRIKEYTPFLLLLIGLVVALGNLLLAYRSFLETGMAGVRMPGLLHETVFMVGTAGIMALIWLALVLLFYIIPNTKVHIIPAALGAVISTGAIFLLSRLLVFVPTLFISRSFYVFGSLAVLPVLLLILYTFWTTVLYGAAVAFIYQRLYHSKGNGMAEPSTAAFNRMEKDVLDALKCVHALSRSEATKGRKAVPGDLVARQLSLSARAVEALAAPLVDLKLVSMRRIRSGAVYAPRKPLAEVDLNAVHGLLLRIDPAGLGELRPLTALDELKHTLGILYSSGKLSPPLLMGDVLAKPQGKD